MNDRKEVSPVKKSIASVLPFLVVMVFVLSCSGFGPSIPADTPQPANTEAPKPSDTPIPADTEAPTKSKKSTPNKAATNRAKEEQTSAVQTEFAAAVLGEVESKLDEVGEIMGAGSVIWLSPDPFALESSKANMIYYQLLDESIQAGDFAFHSVIKWETRGNTGIVNCVIMFRIGEDIDMDPWYSLRLSRYSGASSVRFDVWQSWAFGSGDWVTSRYIREGNGDENEVILVARAGQMTAYVNGKQVTVWWNSKLDYGRFGLGTLQDTGTTTCTYSDNWIWAWS